MAMNGIDISSYQRGLDLSKVPCDFVIIKATEGTGHVQSDTCDKWVQQAKSLGKKWGFYHFMNAADPVAQANWFVKNTMNYFGEGIPVLDYEMYGRTGTANAKKFLDRVYELTSVRCLVYTSRSVLTEENWGAIAPNHGLWVAQYASNNTTGYQSSPWLPSGSFGAWSGCVIHQYSSAGRLDGWGSNLDLDIAYMTPDQWDAYARGDRKTDASDTKPNEPVTPLPDSLSGYKDLDPNAWYIGPIETAVKNGWMNGKSDTEFAPNQALTRGEAVSVISNIADASFEKPYNDVCVGEPYYYNAVVWAKDNGIINGEFESFRPNDPCSRAELVAMICNWQHGTAADISASFDDWDDVPDWSKASMSWAIAKGVVNGDANMLRPNDPCSRAECAAMMVNLFSTK